MLDGSPPLSLALVAIGVVHRRRLREVYRSAGWPCQDAVEIERVARAAPKRPARMSFALWMALARATPVDGWRFDEAQGALGANAQVAPSDDVRGAPGDASPA